MLFAAITAGILYKIIVFNDCDQLGMSRLSLVMPKKQQEVSTCALAGKYSKKIQLTGSAWGQEV